MGASLKIGSIGYTPAYGRIMLRLVGFRFAHRVRSGSWRDMHHEKAEQDILVTQQVYQRAQSDLAGSRPRAYQLKGFQQPIELYTA